MLGKDESIPELAQMIRKLTRQAYANASSNLLDVLALDHFIDALTDADMRFRLREARPKNIAEAEIIAVRIETSWQTNNEEKCLYDQWIPRNSLKKHRTSY